MTRAACTIVSFNYLPYARTLCASFLALHPECKFYVLLVDRLPEGFVLSQEQFELVAVEDLGILDFPSVAFKYDILELNTNVKPTFLKMLLARGLDEIIYLDPDIFIYQALAPVFESLAKYAIVLTPHALSPVPDHGQSELVLLSAGIFNLGFLAIKRCQETDLFLSWWEARCLELAYDEQRASMFVDQKWINLVPCFFDSVEILKHQGCNVAYWNLHERQLSRQDNGWMVNETDPLLFFHFSGISVDGKERISKYTEKLTLLNRPDLRSLFENYRTQLIKHGIRETYVNKYAFDTFDNGQFINRLTRSLFAANLDRFSGENPFHSSSKFYTWARAKHLLSVSDSAKTYTSKSYSNVDSRIRFIHTTLRLALRTLGADRYTILMKYLSYISILRNQRDVLVD
jgi:hypothetical protein